MDLDNILNSAQLEAVQQNEHPLLVFAGAGSGKTRVITYKIAYLVSQMGVDPYNILAVTFTNKAANEMRERVAVIQGGKLPFLTLKTFHALGAGILRQHADLLGYRSDYTIYDDHDQQVLLKKIIKEKNVPLGKWPARKFSWYIDRAKNLGLGPEDEFPDYNPSFERQFSFGQTASEVYQIYQEKLEKANAMDFGDLLYLLCRLWKEHPQVLQKYRQRWRYVLVDEFQDTNIIQYQLLKLLCQGDEHLICVVGDDDQSIYSWRGAEVENIARYKEDFPTCQEILLERNYRSTNQILSLANSVIQQNSNRAEKKLWTALPDGPKAKFYCLNDEREEAQMVVQQLEEFRDNSEYSLGDCAILYRTNAQSRVFEEILTRNGIPYSLVGGFKFYERKEIKDLLAYLRLLINPDSDLDFTRVVNTPARGIGKVTLQKLQKISLQKGLSLYKTVKFLEQNKDEIKPAPLKKLLAFCQIFDQVREENRLMDPARAVELILLHSGYKEALVNEDSIEAESRIENLDEFFNMAMVFREKEKEELGIFLQELSLLTDLDDFQESDERITLMTVHAAKGLEFPVTFLTGLEDDLFPHIRSKENDQEIQEERRLLYVAITRTRRHLNLSYCRMRRVQGMPLVRRMSPFFNRIPEDLFQCYCMVGGQIFERTRAELLATPIREPGSYNKFSGQRYKGGSNYSSTNYNVSKTSNSSPVSPRRAAGNSASGVEGDQDLTKGGLVTHKKFGRGVVKSTEGRGEECKATVIFESGATKKILARFLSAC